MAHARQRLLRTEYVGCTHGKSGLSVVPVEQCRFPAMVPVKSLGAGGNYQ